MFRIPLRTPRPCGLFASSRCLRAIAGIALIIAGAFLPATAQAQEVTLADWDVSTAVSYGVSPLTPTTAEPNVTVLPLTKGSGVSSPATGAANRGWGGVDWQSADAATAIGAGKFFTFGVTPNAGFKVSFTQIDRLDYRRSGTGASQGSLQYQVGSGAFVDLAALSFTVTTSGGAALGPFDLSIIPALQNVPSGTPVTFRIVPFAASGAGGTFYIFDVANTTAADLSVKGVVATAGGTPPTITAFTPSSGPPGTVVTINGTLFGASPTVSFNGTAAPGATVNGAGTQITATVPSGATTGTIRVSTAGGSVVSGATFTVPLLPVLTVETEQTFVAENGTLNGTVSRPLDAPSPNLPLTVTLNSSNTARATVNASVVIPANQFFTNFTVTGVPDNVFGPTANITITASAANYSNGTASVAVTNVDPSPTTTPTVVINKWLNVAPDSAELLVIGNGTPGTTLNMSGMIIKDFSGNIGNDGGGKRVFSNPTLFDAVPVGTLIVVSASVTSADTDPSDFVLRLGLNDLAYFSGATGNFDLSATEMVMIKSAGSPEAGQDGAIHAMAARSTTPTTPDRFDLTPSSKLVATGSNSAIAGNSTSSLADFNGTDATSSSSLTAADLGKANNPSNNAYIRSLRGISTLSGVGAATIANDTAASLYLGRNIFGRGLTGQRVSLTLISDVSPGTLTRASIVVPVQFGVPLAANVSVTGDGAGMPVVSITGQTINVTGLAATTVNPAIINMGGLMTPSPTGPTADGRYLFTVSTAGPSGSPAAIASAPAAVVIIPIESLRDVDPITGVPNELSKVVAVSGVITEENFNNSQLSGFIQDGAFGLNIFSFTPGIASLVRGNRYVITGSVVQFAGLTEISPAVATDIIDLGPGTPPVPLVVTPLEISSPTDPQLVENLEGRLVTVKGLVYVSGNWVDPTGTNINDIVLADSGSNNITIRIAQATEANSPPASYPATITGILSQAAPTNTNLFTGYVVMPRDAADIVVDAASGGYSNWAAAFPGIGAPEIDADGDGDSNYLEYALGTIPNDRSSVQPLLPTMISGRPGLSITKGIEAAADTRVVYQIEGSADLINWGTSLTPASNLEQVTNSSTTYAVRYLGTSGKYYFRLKVGPPG